jgi:hypothetical protein
MLVDGVPVMSLSAWITAGRKTLKAEDDPLTKKGNYPTISGQVAISRGIVLGAYRSATGRSATGGVATRQKIRPANAGRKRRQRRVRATRRRAFDRAAPNIAQALFVRRVLRHVGAGHPRTENAQNERA